MPTARDKIPKPLVLLILLASILVVTGAVLLYPVQRYKVLERTYYDLDLITSLKSEELRKWRMEHIRDAYIIRQSVMLNALVRDFIRKEDAKKKTEICDRLNLFVENYDYHSVVVIDTTGLIRILFPDTPDTRITNNLDVNAFNLKDVDFSDLHYSQDMKGIHMDVSIPVTDGNSKVTGLIVLRIDPEITLFPTINTGQTRGKSSETILIRLEGNSLTYLNRTLPHPLKHRKYKTSLNKHNLVAGLAVVGNEGRYEGLDYRNITVLSFIRRIPGSPWFIVSKIDREEALEVLHQQTKMISVIVFLALTSLITTIFYLWRSQNSKFYRELSNTKDKFVSIITHDLTNPFVSIVGFCEILIGDLKKKNYVNAEKYAGIIRDSSMSAVELLKNLAQWSKIQTNQIKPNPTKINLSSLIDQSIGVLKAFADRKSVTIIKHTPPEFWIIADKEMISTVVRNLLANAIKYSFPGGTIMINAFRGRNEAKVEVKDSGVGIEKGTLQKILGSDEIITMPGTMSETGSGFGLRLSREFIARHGGGIWAESEAGKGSVFVFTIPLNQG
ncbi:MAG TPA: ATP-binding protein [Bacteroidales bacterium]|nr:ATP-binding protein [Bacteroidales bacterium]